MCGSGFQMRIWIQEAPEYRSNTVKYQSSDTLYKFGHCRVFYKMVSCDQRTDEKVHYTVLNNIEGS